MFSQYFLTQPFQKCFCSDSIKKSVSASNAQSNFGLENKVTIKCA